MRKENFWIFILLLISFKTIAQIEDRTLKYHFFHNNNNSTPYKTIDYSDIKGSPYLTEDFVMSKIYYRLDSILEIALRYNVYNQSMEYKHNNIVYAISNPDVIEKIEMGKSIFVYYYNWKKEKNNSYYELLVSGKSYLLAKKNIDFRKAEFLKAIAEPDQFIKRDDSYYVVKDNLFRILIKNKKSLVEIFSDKNNEIRKIIKDDKISHKKREDLIKLVGYYNSL